MAKPGRVTFTLLITLAASAVFAAEPPEIELLLSGGTLYSLAHRSYRSLHLPEGWSVAAAVYSPDGVALAVIVKGVEVPHPPTSAPSPTPHGPTPVGPVTKIVRAWKPSTHLLLLDRSTGAVLRTWTLPVSALAGDWMLAWTLATGVHVAFHASAPGTPLELTFTIDPSHAGIVKPEVNARLPNVSLASGDCQRTLTETQFHKKILRFIKDAAHCSTPPETADIYRLVYPQDVSSKEDILWEYRVPTDQTACAEPYACYTGADAQFLSLDERRFLVWDGDLFSLHRTDDGIDAQLITQLLPQFIHPWGIAAKETHLNALDWETAMPFQPVSEGLRIPRGDGPMLYAQNFLPTRSFNATVDVGDYKKNVMVPAGSQVGPLNIGSFKDRAYTPVLSTLRWTSFHHLADPIYCKTPYTISPNTLGLIVSIREDKKGDLECQIHFQEER